MEEKQGLRRCCSIWMAPCWTQSRFLLKLWMRCLDEATTKFIPLCEGIEGTIGLLNVDEVYTDGEVNLPIGPLYLI